ncbi:P-loop containing nucleoside triphosphate hydrolase [Botrimarina colliarenosi]|uniref:P-loop containing nucleoside triphosphate hydrolase n=1 Tax=Botrimarina colliarenosi TaxID=2528001 RepID=A0A5C6A5F4_9BACT|nr:ABC transporter ATP-binding protein [Botrimarina colliarenosi]TWT95174.1 P-loop containing nucleoside triphosphate hydrolase [Botrimarina colliarenosi]
MAPTVLAARGVTKTYRKGAVAVPVLRGADIDVAEGEMLAIVGQSGSGKSTLLHVLGTLDRPDEGEVLYRGQRIDTLSRRRRDAFRNTELGMIFQSYHLLPELTALENVLAPAMIRYGVFAYLGKRRQLRERATALLERVGLGHRMTHKPRELSGGEMQRTAIARALMNEPRLLLADEPTGNLDPTSGDGVLELMRGLNQTDGLTVIMVTHDRAIAALADRTVTLVEGRVAEEAEGLRVQG